MSRQGVAPAPALCLGEDGIRHHRAERAVGRFPGIEDQRVQADAVRHRHLGGEGLFGGEPLGPMRVVERPEGAVEQRRPAVARARRLPGVHLKLADGRPVLRVAGDHQPHRPGADWGEPERPPLAVGAAQGSLQLAPLASNLGFQRPPVAGQLIAQRVEAHQHRPDPPWPGPLDPQVLRGVEGRLGGGPERERVAIVGPLGWRVGRWLRGGQPAPGGAGTGEVGGRRRDCRLARDCRQHGRQQQHGEHEVGAEDGLGHLLPSWAGAGNRPHYTTPPVVRQHRTLAVGASHAWRAAPPVWKSGG